MFAFAIDRGGNATSSCQSSCKAMCANKYVQIAYREFLFSLDKVMCIDGEGVVSRPCAYAVKDDALPFRKCDSSTKHALRDGF